MSTSIRVVLLMTVFPTVTGSPIVFGVLALVFSLSLSLLSSSDQDDITGSKKSLSSVTINAGLKVDKELDYQLLRLLSKL